MAREAFTDADTFTLTFAEGADLTPQQKATTMSSVVILDYMLFEQVSDLHLK